jgi:glycosyltransferase involved in cell wall biosynthesis
MIKKNKAFLLIDLSGEIGGAQKRNIALCKYILEQRDDIFILINDRLFENYLKHGLISDHQNIRILKLSDSVKNSESQINGKSEIKTITKRDYPKFILFIAKIKQFFKLFLKWLLFCFEICKIILSAKIGTVYALWTGGIWVWPLKKILRFKLIYGYNDADLTWLSRNFLDFFDSEYWVMKYSDKIDFLSERIRDDFEKKIFKIDQERISISPCSFVIYDNYYPEYPKEEIAIFLGRFVPQRNILLILNAIYIYQQSKRWNDRLAFYFIGDGREKSKAIQYIADNGLRNVHLMGKSFYPWEYLRKSKIFITVATENYPSQSLLEAMACENVIIASDVGDTRKLISSEEGILVPLEAGEIANAIQLLFENPEECKRLGKNARRKAIENHNIEKYAKYFYSLIEVE